MAEEHVNSPNGTRNQLLSQMSLADRDRLAHSLETIDLDVRQILEAPGDAISHAYFVESGLVSVVGTAPPGHRIEIGMVGYEGMSGVGIVLGDDRSPNETMVRAAGSAMRIAAQALRDAIAASPTLASILLRYAHVFMVQSGQTALANGRGRLDERLARWLLMWDDRIRPEHLTVTHDFLALLFGVRRPGVTDTMNDLEGRGLIRSSRGKVLIVNREALKLAANGFYGVPEAEYERALGTSGSLARAERHSL
jgi:CRP-like cAMP-binding protein